MIIIGTVLTPWRDVALAVMHPVRKKMQNRMKLD